MDESDIEHFCAHARLAILERLVLKTALGTRVLSGEMTIQEGRDDLKDWLDKNSAIGDAPYGTRFQDPAIAGLYSEELKAVVEGMKRAVDQITREVLEAME
jgi:23S rRNA G2445 N2-methylase RlmL